MFFQWAYTHDLIKNLKTYKIQLFLYISCKTNWIMLLYWKSKSEIQCKLTQVLIHPVVPILKMSACQQRRSVSFLRIRMWRAWSRLYLWIDAGNMPIHASVSLEQTLPPKYACSYPSLLTLDAAVFSPWDWLNPAGIPCLPWEWGGCCIWSSNPLIASSILNLKQGI